MNKEKKSDGSFKFILTFLTAVGTIIYTSYYYFQTSTLDDTLFSPVMAFITLLVIFSFFLITYILIKGFSPLVEDHQVVNYLIKKINVSEVDKGITLTIILIWLVLSIYTIINLILVVIRMPFFSFFWFLIIFFVSILFILRSVNGLFLFSWDDIPGSDEGRLKEFLKQKFYIDWINNAKIEKLYNDIIIKVSNKHNFVWLSLNSQKTEANLIIHDSRTDDFIIKRENGKLNLYQKSKISKIFIISLVISLLIFSAAWNVSYVPISILFQGHVEIHMDNDIYYKDNAPIPVSIDITGRKIKSTIYLYNKSSASSLIQIDNITLEPNHQNANISGANQTLFGNVFSSGIYNIFINTTNPNMTEGYYELVYSRSNITEMLFSYSNPYMFQGYKYIGKSFYLLNNRTK